MPVTTPAGSSVFPSHRQRILVVPLVADRGLCGGYNANVLRPTERMVRARPRPGWSTGW